MDTSPLGMNKTGLQMSPVDAANLRRAGRGSPATDSASSALAMAAFREPYLHDARPIGSVPIPGTLAGAVRAGVSALAADRLHALIDRLGERLAFERSGTRLYDALIAKCDARPDEADVIDLELLAQFRDQEATHFQLLVDVIDELGGDPTAQTPAADVSAVSGIGLMQVALDPRTTVEQSLQVLLSAELIDNDGWELLIRLTADLGYEEIADRFAEAASDEELHLRHVRRWLDDSAKRSMKMV